jgi:hypothetical protein
MPRIVSSNTTTSAGVRLGARGTMRWKTAHDSGYDSLSNATHCRRGGNIRVADAMLESRSMQCEVSWPSGSSRARNRSECLKKDTIFVAIASYRDPECPQTVRDLFEKAYDPGRIFVGICWQALSGDDDSLQVSVRPDQIRRIRCDARHSRGACWAKGQAQKLWRREQYLLNIDSHMRLTQGWDRAMIEALRGCAASKPILSTYPAAYEPPERLSAGTPHLVAKEFDAESGLLLLHGIHRDMDAPKRGAFVSGNFSFCSALFIREVPYDPFVYFYGEEISMSVRAWSRGWDVFTPHHNLIYHCYERPFAPRHWEDHKDWWKRDRVSVSRVRRLLGVSPGKRAAMTVRPYHSYGLGRVRTVEEFERFAGVFFKQRIITERAQLGDFG